MNLNYRLNSILNKLELILYYINCLLGQYFLESKKMIEDIDLFKEMIKEITKIIPKEENIDEYEIDEEEENKYRIISKPIIKSDSINKESEEESSSFSEIPNPYISKILRPKKKFNIINNDDPINSNPDDNKKKYLEEDFDEYNKIFINIIFSKIEERIKSNKFKFINNLEIEPPYKPQKLY